MGHLWRRSRGFGWGSFTYMRHQMFLKYLVHVSRRRTCGRTAVKETQEPLASRSLSPVVVMVHVEVLENICLLQPEFRDIKDSRAWVWLGEQRLSRLLVPYLSQGLLSCTPQAYKPCTWPTSGAKKEPRVSNRGSHGLMDGGSYMSEARSHRDTTVRWRAGRMWCQSLLWRQGGESYQL